MPITVRHPSASGAGSRTRKACSAAAAPPVAAAVPVAPVVGSHASPSASWMASSDALYSSACRSAPEKPSVAAAISSRSTASSSRRLRAWARRMSARSSSSGIGQHSALSSRPGRSSAGSIRSGRDVAASTYTPCRPSAPSICVSSWLTTRSVTPVESCPRRGAIASNSSKNRMHGRATDARSNRSRVACSDAPMYLLSSSGPLMLTKFRPHSRATADARNVLPHPGGPYSSRPERRRSGHCANSGAYRVGHSSVSSSTRLVSRRPPMSLQLTVDEVSLTPRSDDGVKLRRASSRSACVTAAPVSLCVLYQRKAAWCSARLTSPRRSAAEYPSVSSATCARSSGACLLSATASATTSSSTL
eukprot:Unigene15378_Nuclearia_a/m.45974 Unigene15378_Nuclearia_a/g.45974  ORF Unigene15378_Nuclearia_a/g.45974 Unigene15378_Nuclearia_a/m.45974 type:complete len:361 (+) Unigene15378_Nuclearia_a:346-1428(+)